jgi:hypothetical protein
MTTKTYKLYYPYKSDKPDKKYFVIVESERPDTYKKIYFGASGYEHFTYTPDYKDLAHLDWKRRENYENRHRLNEDWGKGGVKTRGWWSYWYLWKYQTHQDATIVIREKLKNWGFPVDRSITVRN